MSFLPSGICYLYFINQKTFYNFVSSGAIFKNFFLNYLFLKAWNNSLINCLHLSFQRITSAVSDEGPSSMYSPYQSLYFASPGLMPPRSTLGCATWFLPVTMSQVLQFLLEQEPYSYPQAGLRHVSPSITMNDKGRYTYLRSLGKMRLLSLMRGWWLFS